MYRIKKFEVWASEIASFLNADMVGEDILINGPRSIKTHSRRSFFNGMSSEGDCKFLLITDAPECSGSFGTYITSSRPELDLGYVLREFFATSPANTIHPSAVVSEEAKIGRNVQIGAHSVIGPDVEIGDNTRILNNVVLNGPMTIGKFCVIKDGAVIGSEGWGFSFDDEGIPFHSPQLGSILIEDNVWVGSNSTIERSMADDTVIAENAKIDDLVHVGGGCRIGPLTMLTAGVVISQNVVVGEAVHISPQAVVRENLCLADRTIVGQGAVVLKDLDFPGIYVGNPARILLQKTELDKGE